MNGKVKAWMVAFALLLILQFLVVAPTLTPEDLVTTVPLMASLGMEGYMVVFSFSLALSVLGLMLLFLLSKRTLRKYLK